MHQLGDLSQLVHKKCLKPAIKRARNITIWVLIMTQFSSLDKTLLCSAYSFCRDPVFYVETKLLCIVLKSLSRHIKVCRDLVSLWSAYFCVAMLRSMSRHRFISSA